MKITEGRKAPPPPSTWAEKRQTLIEILEYQYDYETLEDIFNVSNDSMSSKILKQYKQRKAK